MRQAVVTMLVLVLALGCAVAPEAPAAACCASAGGDGPAAKHLGAAPACCGHDGCTCAARPPSSSAPQPKEKTPSSEQSGRTSVFLAASFIGVEVGAGDSLLRPGPRLYEAQGFAASRSRLRRHLQLSILRD